MSEFVYKDYVPQNARIIVDYKAREKVKFSYPRHMTYWKAVWTNAYPTVIFFWLHLHINIMFYFILLLAGIGYLLKSIFFPTIVSSSPEYLINFMFVFFKLILPIVGVFTYFFGVPAVFTYYLARDKERLSSWIPKIGYWGAMIDHHTKYRIFTKGDVSDKKAIIPIFSNVYLNYECEGDFDRYLEKVEIMEIPFHYKIRGFFFPFRKKTQYNDFKFRAVFHFSRSPNNGKMEVTFV